MSGLPSYMGKDDDSPSKKGRKQEAKARQHIASGSVWFDQYDLDAEKNGDKYLIDVKRTDGTTFQLNKKKLEKLFKAAIKQGKAPAYLIYFGDDFIVKCVIQRNNT